MLLEKKVKTSCTGTWLRQNPAQTETLHYSTSTHLMPVKVISHSTASKRAREIGERIDRNHGRGSHRRTGSICPAAESRHAYARRLPERRPRSRRAADRQQRCCVQTAIEAAKAERERIRRELAADQLADHAPVESSYGLTCRTCVTWQDDEGAEEFGIAIPEQWPCHVARALADPAEG